LPALLAELGGRLQRLEHSYGAGKPFVKLKFHDFSQTTVEQAGAGHALDSYQLLLSAAFARAHKPVRLIGVGVRLLDLRASHEQLELFVR
jgi:DNA polymerase-4